MGGGIQPPVFYAAGVVRGMSEYGRRCRSCGRRSDTVHQCGTCNSMVCDDCDAQFCSTCNERRCDLCLTNGASRCGVCENA